MNRKETHRQEARGRVLFRSAIAVTLLAGASQAQFAPPEAEHHVTAVEGTEPYALCYRDTLSGSIDSTVDTDIVQFFGEPGDVVQLVLYSGTGLDPSITVLDPQGMPLVDPLGNNPPYGCSNACSLLEVFTLSSVGVHTLLISDSGLDEGGAYTMGLELLTPDRPLTSIDYGPSYSVVLDNTADHDFVSFEGEAGNLVTFALSSPTGLDPRVDIWAPDGSLFQSASCNNACSLSIPSMSLPQTGTYLIQVYDGGQDEGGTATISLTCLLGGCPPQREDIDLGATYCSSNPNSTGMVAGISARGSSDPDDNYFSLAVTDVPSAKLGIFFFGTNATSSPFGQGVKCIANPVRRLPPLRLGATAGETYLTPDLTDLPGNTVFTPGSTWLFQFWYRDQNPFATTNLSDGLSVTF